MYINKIIIIFVFLFFISNNAFSKETVNTKPNTKITPEKKKEIKKDFGTLNWWETSDKILESTKKQPKIKDSEKIVFDDDLLGIESEVTFFLKKDKFVKVSYNVTKKYSSNEEIMIDISKIRKKFLKEYGKAILDSNPEIDAMTSDNYNSFLKVVLDENQSISTTWKKDRTEVKLTLKKNFMFFNSIEIVFSPI